MLSCCVKSGALFRSFEVDGMSLTLDQFIEETKADLEGFSAEYKMQNAENPDHYPLELDASNAGLWLEFLVGYMTRSGED